MFESTNYANISLMTLAAVLILIAVRQMGKNSLAIWQIMALGALVVLFTGQISPEDALRNAGRLMKEANAHAVKLEGGREFAEAVRRMVASGIPVMGHLGLTPQSVHQLGGYKVQGKEESAARRILEDAKILEEAGAFSLVLECVPAGLGEEISKALRIPTIGIGGGVHCDGQVLVVHDMLGMFERFTPKFVKKYAALNTAMREAVGRYVEEVRQGVFPGKEHSF